MCVCVSVTRPSQQWLPCGIQLGSPSPQPTPGRQMSASQRFPFILTHRRAILVCAVVRADNPLQAPPQI